MEKLLYSKSKKINDYVSIYIPTVGEIYENSETYENVIGIITATPYSMMVQLDQIGIDFCKITEWELFLLLFDNLKEMDTSLIYGDLKLSDFEVVRNKENKQLTLLNPKTGQIFDELVFIESRKFFSSLYHIDLKNKLPANEDAKQFMIERAAKKLKRRQQKETKSEPEIERQIIALVNDGNFPYDYESVLNISIYQFNSSLSQISHRINFNNTMIGCYSGSIDVNKIPPDDLIWMYQKK